jgi:hypothetical protein
MSARICIYFCGRVAARTFRRSCDPLRGWLLVESPGREGAAQAAPSSTGSPGRASSRGAATTCGSGTTFFEIRLKGRTAPPSVTRSSAAPAGSRQHRLTDGTRRHLGETPSSKSMSQSRRGAVLRRCSAVEGRCGHEQSGDELVQCSTVMDDVRPCRQIPVMRIPAPFTLLRLLISMRRGVKASRIDALRSGPASTGRMPRARMRSATRAFAAESSPP